MSVLPVTKRGRLESRGATCRSCRKPIAWAKTKRGKLIPLNPDPSPDGDVLVTGVDHTPRGPVLLVESLFGDSIKMRVERRAAQAEGNSLYTPHFHNRDRS